MHRFKTKNDVIGGFGLPTEKRQEEGVTEWLYDLGNGAIETSYSQNNATARVTDYGNSAYGTASKDGLTVSHFNSYRRYVKFILNDRDQVISYQSQGVDFTKKKSRPGMIILILVLCAGAGVALGAATSQ